jgi:heme-degrading monooxygenase HmoA
MHVRAHWDVARIAGGARAVDRASARGGEAEYQSGSGLRAVYWLVDRAAGTGMIVTFWETREAMEASERARAARQAATSAATGATVTTERYEVVDWLTL